MLIALRLLHRMRTRRDDALVGVAGRLSGYDLAVLPNDRGLVDRVTCAKAYSA